MKKDRGKVWLGVAAVIENHAGEWLVVEKTYGGLKGRWSLPAGFVQQAETADMAAKREVKEETGIDCTIQGLIGFRTGVIREDISDNMAIFYGKALTEHIQIQEDEILAAFWIAPDKLAKDAKSSVMLAEMSAYHVQQHQLDLWTDIDPGKVFGYTTYHLFFNQHGNKQ
ncbi:NUDIX hydrolase [Metasolibacillus sp.]|uniref:NUDIX domain-containing protein n=1 Tax=Metasolibacillus sp. TaxID=2703680 RepID=UPI0025EFDA4F|nr:NUDIX hydrolase [Metasolibacillus sp.]MCT6924993.1 NUDIX hydrolase [Metasolibacillus sp.]MCT6942050.1 NUDIX hydrolase [Metasolibacillus sp.]